jgi:hypothetical protein
MFLREACVLPDQLTLHQSWFCRDWMLVDDLTAVALDAMIRNAGWHFMWMLGSCCRRGWGWTHDEAVHQALERALKKTGEQFNASELDSVVIKKYTGVFMAKVILHPRVIQQMTSLDTPRA